MGDAARHIIRIAKHRLFEHSYFSVWGLWRPGRREGAGSEIRMRQTRRTHLHGAGAVIAAVLALSFFAASPVLLAHHHHAIGEDDAHCAICLFVSAQVAPAQVPYDAAPQLTTIGLVQTADEIRVPTLPIRLNNERAPPTA